jgi:hypothetical protein
VSPARSAAGAAPKRLDARRYDPLGGEASGSAELCSRLTSSAGDVAAAATTMTVAAGEGACLRNGDIVRVPRTGEAAT